MNTYEIYTENFSVIFQADTMFEGLKMFTEDYKFDRVIRCVDKEFFNA